jgi:hypothetical protein
MNQAAQKKFPTRTDGDAAVISAASKYHLPDNFQTCTVEVQGRGDGAESGWAEAGIRGGVSPGVR